MPTIPEPFDLDAAFVENLLAQFDRATTLAELRATQTGVAIERVRKIAEVRPELVALVRAAYEQRKTAASPSFPPSRPSQCGW